MKSRLPIVFLLLIHLPFLIGYVLGLRANPAYQFGPVVWCIVALLCWRRNGGRVESKRQFPAIRVLIDLVCVILAIVTGEFGIGVLGGLVWVHAFLTRYRDKEVDSSLGYLCSALFFTVCPPFAATDGILDQMTGHLAGLASWFLDQFHYLHVTTSHSIEVAGHSFHITQVRDVFFSASAFLCFASVFLCVMRRTWAHAIPSMLASFIIALLTQATMLCVIVVVWQEYGMDASIGVERLLLSAAVFTFGLLAFISLDVLLSAFTEPVPLMSTATINPLAILWNRMFHAVSRRELEEVQESGGRYVKSILEEAPSVLGMVGPWTVDFCFPGL